MDPKITKKDQSHQADMQIMEMVKTFGTKWTVIAKMLPGRMPAWSKSVLRVQSTLAQQQSPCGHPAAPLQRPCSPLVLSGPPPIALVYRLQRRALADERLRQRSRVGLESPI